MQRSSSNAYSEALVSAGATCTLLPVGPDAWDIIAAFESSADFPWMVLIDFGSDAAANQPWINAQQSGILCRVPWLALLPANDQHSAWPDFDGATEQCLIKPVSATEVVAAVHGQLRESMSMRLAASTTLATTSRPLRVLLVDDAEVNQMVASGILEILGHHCVIANDGVEAVELVLRERFDVILMDIEMPRLDGFGATERIRMLERELGYHTPIVAMTAHALTGFEDNCRRAGMNDYLTKPIQPDRLAACLASFPSAAQGEAAASKPVLTVGLSPLNGLGSIATMVR